MPTKNDFDPNCITQSQMNMIHNSRIYYRRLTTWFWTYLFSRYWGIGTAEDAFGRLYLEALDIGNMLQILFSREYAEQYSQLLSRFTTTLRELLGAQREGNAEAVSQYVNSLYENVAERAAFLARINPYWSEEEYNELLGTYTRYILEDANAIASRDFIEDLELHDRFISLTNRMGDVFAEGLFDYITSGTGIVPPEEGEPCITYDQVNQIYNIRIFWYEMAIWTRNYMLSKYAGLGDVERDFARLKRVPAIYLNYLRGIFGDRVSEEYEEALNAYVELLDAFFSAQMEGNIDEINRITQLLYQNADQRATLVSAINPFWDAEIARSRLYNNIRATIDESTTFLTGDYARNIDIFSRLLDQAESMSYYLAQGLFDYISYTHQEIPINA